MIKDFLILLPELYGQSSCTANAHALSHLPKFVRLWGPLWTHSAFGFESKNGHLKNLIHAKSSILDQLVFSIDVAQTTQLLHHELEKNESEQTMSYLARLRGQVPRSSVGKQEYAEVTEEDATALSLPSGSYVRTFSRAYLHAVLYHTTSYDKRKGKRNSRICKIFNEHGDESFGEIQSFIDGQSLAAKVNVFQQSQQT